MKKEIISRIKKLEDKLGRITPHIVLNDARKVSSPLHNEFEWDDSKAGELHRLDQARTLIRSVKIVIVTETQTVKSVAYVRDPGVAVGEQGYRAIDNLRTEKGLAHEALVAEFVRVSSALRRARDLAAAFNLENEVADLYARAEKLQFEVEARALHS